MKRMAMYKQKIGPMFWIKNHNYNIIYWSVYFFFFLKKKKKEKRPAVNRCIFTILLPVSFELLFFQVK